MVYTMRNTNLFTKFTVAAVLALSIGSVHAQSAAAQPKTEKLLNGLNILMWPDKSKAQVEVKVRIHDGSAFDPQGKEGVMQLLADNIFPNVASREFFSEDLGGHLDVKTTYDFIEVDAAANPEHFLTLLETLASAVSNPVIDKENTALIQKALLARLAGMESTTAYVADRAAAKRLFGTFPYGRPQMGTTESVRKLVFADLVDAKERFLTADNATITISGNFDRDLAFKAIKRYFGGWLKADKIVPSTFRQPDPPNAEPLDILSPQSGESAIVIAARGVARNSKDLAASLIFTAILENRLKDRLPIADMTKVSVRDDVHNLPGSIVIALAASKQSSDGDIQKTNVKESIAKALAEDITDAEFQLAKKMVGDEWSRRDTPTMWLDAATFGLSSATADNSAISDASLSDVRLFANKFAKAPMVTVLAASPKNN